MNKNDHTHKDGKYEHVNSCIITVNYCDRNWNGSQRTVTQRQRRVVTGLDVFGEAERNRANKNRH